MYMPPDDTFKTRDGKTLHQRSWPSPTKPRAHLIYLHGYAEYAARFDAPANALNEAGITVHAYDQRGHGNSPGRPGYIHRFKQSVQDCEDYLDHIAPLIDDLPLFILGHSAGGLLLATLAQQRPHLATGLLFSSPYLALTPGISPILIALADIISIFAPTLPGHVIDTASITDNPDHLQAYLADPKIYHGKITARTGTELIHAIQNARAHFEELELPYYLFHSTDDQLAPINGSQELHAKANSPDKSFDQYPGCSHELMLDTGNDIVLAKLIAWICDRC
jgi:alpha-beta hydrolase superfamily lysophospholipase